MRSTYTHNGTSGYTTQLMRWNSRACPDRHREPLLAHDYPHPSVYTYMGRARPDRHREPPVNLVDPDGGRAH